MDAYMHKCASEHEEERKDEWADERVNEGTDEWMEG